VTFLRPGVAAYIVFLALERLRQEDHMFKASLLFIGRPHQNEMKLK
jgi:hypothetical protein